MQRPGQVFTRSFLLDTVWGGTTGAYTNLVDLYVHYLRKKLDRMTNLPACEPCTAPAIPSTPDRNTPAGASPGQNRYRNLMLDRMRWRLTLGYAGVFALILFFLGTAAVAGFSRELTIQQDTLLTQEAKDQTEICWTARTGRSSQGFGRVQLDRTGPRRPSHGQGSHRRGPWHPGPPLQRPRR